MPSPQDNTLINGLNSFRDHALFVKAKIDEIQHAPLPVAGRALGIVYQTRRILKSVEMQLKDLVMSEMIDKNLNIIALGETQIIYRDGKERKDWKEESLKQEIVDRLTQKITSANPNLSRMDVQRIVGETIEAMGVIARQEWRSRGLKEYGIDPDEFSSNEFRQPSLEISGEDTYYNGAPSPNSGTTPLPPKPPTRKRS